MYRKKFVFFFVLFSLVLNKPLFALETLPSFTPAVLKQVFEGYGAEGLIRYIAGNIGTRDQYFSTATATATIAASTSPSQQEKSFKGMIAALADFRTTDVGKTFVKNVREKQRFRVDLFTLYGELWSRVISLSSSYEVFLDNVADYCLFLFFNPKTKSGDAAEERNLYFSYRESITKKLSGYKTEDGRNIVEVKSVSDVLGDIISRKLFTLSVSNETVTNRDVSQGALALKILDMTDARRAGPFWDAIYERKNLKKGAEKLADVRRPNAVSNARTRITAAVASCLGAWTF